MARTPRWLRVLGIGALVALLAWRVGPAALGDALRGVDPRALALAAVAALAVAAVSTLCVAWRWVLVARGLGLELSLPDAVAASYRAQFLNVTLPVGVAGDVHRAVSHGRSAGDVGRGVRAVVWERTAGQVVQVGLALAVLVAVASPLRSVVTDHVAAIGAVGLALVVTVSLLLRIRLRDSASRASRLARALTSDVRNGLLARRVWPGVVAASAIAVAGHLATFLLAARAAGVAVTPMRVVPIAFVVLLAAALPLNVAGWGPREGAAAWAFGVAGLGAAQGVVVAVVYGGLVIVAGLPGAVVLLRDGAHRPRRAGGRVRVDPPDRAEGVVGGARA
ncbi:lysylphosphatidylglycerol synthase transmembrane domain-containing protein [Intrasporangium sp. YIM S08009]|uniref:lysylphosphatidylglycerol synthase transmembrane domain-containing protein n=1 Tax=Intrasporangium zincisolvens TaxID=3080018 RepID=UPI002B05430B|nr:lysylphosphatidylglycerol synthase transmembrane domain-containing protein [Intrasporangium sp. YIM S08009]